MSHRIKTDIGYKEKNDWSDNSSRMKKRVKCLDMEFEEGYCIDRFIGILKLADIKLTEIEKTEELFETKRSIGNEITGSREMLDQLLDEIDEKERFLRNL